VEGPVRPGPAAQPVYGVSLDSLGTGAGTFAVPAGNTLATNPSNRGPVEGPVGGPEVSALDGELQAEEDHRITSWPERIDAALFRYPEEARREGIEGSVLLRLEIDDRGRVRKAALVRGVNPVLDQAALANAPRLRFAPARAGQKPVPCEIRYTFTFVLD
jgi:TonB family protein